MHLVDAEMTGCAPIAANKPAKNLEECMIFCLSRPECIMAQYTTKCEICKQRPTVIRKSKPGSGVFVGIKFDMEMNECSKESGLKIPNSVRVSRSKMICEKTQPQGTIYGNTSLVKYTIIDDGSDQMQVEYQEKKHCDDGWAAVRRPGGIYCLNVFSDPNPVDEYMARTYCQQKGAVLSGLQDKMEFNIVQKKAKNAAWLYTFLRDECFYDDFAPICKQFPFIWKDPSVTGTDGFIFPTPFPPIGKTYYLPTKECWLVDPNLDYLTSRKCKCLDDYLGGTCSWNIYSYVCSKPGA
ncbi:unnamed protein product [Caenorhabditis bovis]|uniref:PAN-3 domain-containing protein n=1 Tax=Caenorhabditis bovis TaxID=2654633 RepID=A0A8S1EPV2_9PELO|nr:unnamed protein product [Caenorhabditis bovis]